MNLERVKNIIKEYADKKQLNLFEVEYNRSESTLTVLFDEKLNMDALEQISADLSSYLDDYDDEFDDNYILDVSTVGVERPIRNKEELIQAVGKYIYVKTKKEEYNGILKSFEDGVMKLEVKDKTKKKVVDVDYAETKKVRYAVEF